jgi:hypothetical protein
MEETSNYFHSNGENEGQEKIIISDCCAYVSLYFLVYFDSLIL